MKFFSTIADHMIFEATRDGIDPQARRRAKIEMEFGAIEAWVISNDDSTQRQSNSSAFALKFPGTGGRAERGGPHPCEVIAPNDHEVWTVNPPGYGGSDGRASLSLIAEMCDASWHKFAKQAGDNKKIVVGNSLGCMYALYVAARYQVDGVFLRNPVPLKEIIIGRYSWWNFGLGSRLIAKQIPEEIDPIENARACNAPAMFVMSEKDRMIPPNYQQMIIEPYAGEKSVFVVKGADHHHPVEEDQLENYVAAIQEFREMVFAGQADELAN